jgi:RNA polymerase sigma-70 factor, ECF subfamily
MAGGTLEREHPRMATGDMRDARPPGMRWRRAGAALPSRYDARGWLDALHGPSAARAEALEQLHGLLLRAARFELARRHEQLRGTAPGEVDDLATQAADDALLAILRKLDSFRGNSRFTTWAYKFALLEAGVKARRRAWQGREILVDYPAWLLFRHPGRSAHESIAQAELLRALRDALASALTPHQREVFTALAINEVPIDVLADRLATTRGALYKTLHDARRKLRAALAERGFAIA